MKKLAKLFKFLVFFIFLAGLGLIGFILWVDPNEFKDDLTQLVSEKTGHTLKIEGPIQWSFFPGIGLKFQKARFEMQPQASVPFKALQIQEGKTQIALFPILMKQLAIEKVWLKEVALDLNKTQHAHIQTLSLSGLSLSSSDDLSLAEIQIEQAKLFESQHKKPDLIVNFYAKNFTLQKEKLQGDFTIDLKKDALKAHLQTQAKADLKAHTLNLPTFTLNAANAKITGQAQINHFDQAIPDAQIKAHLNKTNVVELLKAFQVPFKPTEHPKTLQANIALNFKNDQLAFDALKLQVDDGTLTGVGHQKSAQAFQFKIQAQKLNIDKLIALQNAISNAPMLASGTTQTRASKPNTASASNSTPASNTDAILLPVEPLRSLNFSGQVQGQDLTLNKMRMSDLQAKIKGEKGLIQIKPLSIKMLDSEHHMTITLNVQGARPKISITEESKPFEISNITKALGQKKQITGATTLKFNLQTTGNTLEALEQNLSGNMAFQIANGALYGIDLDAVLSQAQATVESLFKALKRTNQAKLTNFFGTEIKQWKQPIVNEQARTPFDVIQGNFQIKNRVVQNPSLLLTHANYKITGQGHYNVKTNFVQYRALAYLLKAHASDPAITEFLQSTPIPVVISGPLDNLSYKPDVGSFTQTAMKHFQKEALKKATTKPINKLIEKLGGDKKLPISLDNLFR